MDHPLLRHEPQPFGPEGVFRNAAQVPSRPVALPVAVELAYATALLDDARLRAHAIRRLVARAFQWRPHPTGRALCGLLLGLARTVLPAPPGRVASRAAEGAAAQLFGLELEGFSPEDREFELARAFVRLAAEAARTAARSSSPGTPSAAAATALARAARRHAPGYRSVRGERRRNFTAREAADARSSTRPAASTVRRTRHA